MTYIAIAVGLFVLACIYVGWGYTIVGQNQAAVVERFGKFKRILDPGWHVLCLPGIVDRLTESRNKKHRFIPVLQRFPVEVFSAGEKVDLTNASVGMVIKVWVMVGKEGVDIEAAIYKYVYATEDAKGYLQSLMDDLIRPILQGLSLEEALIVNSDKLLKPEAREDIARSLEVCGLYLVDGDCITIGDIALPDELVTQRDKILVAEREAQARITSATGFRKAAEILAKGENGNAPADERITVREAVDAQNRLAALEALKGADLRLVQSTTGAALDAIMDLAGGQPKRGNQQRPQGKRQPSNRNQTS